MTTELIIEADLAGLLKMDERRVDDLRRRSRQGSPTLTIEHTISDLVEIGTDTSRKRCAMLRAAGKMVALECLLFDLSALASPRGNHADRRR